MKIRPYLTFNGQCQEALNLYSSAFQKEALQIMRFSQLPENPEMPVPESQKDWIIQATFPFGDDFMRMSDCMGDHLLNEASTERISINLECSPAEAKYVFAVLSEEGTVGIPLAETFYSPCAGVVFDKFGIMWNITAQ